MVFLLKILNLGFITTLLFSVTLTLTVGVTVFLEAKLKEFQIEIQRMRKNTVLPLKKKQGFAPTQIFAKDCIRRSIGLKKQRSKEDFVMKKVFFASKKDKKKENFLHYIEERPKINVMNF